MNPIVIQTNITSTSAWSKPSKLRMLGHAATVLLLVAAFPASAQSHRHDASHSPGPASTGTATVPPSGVVAPMEGATIGEIRRVDRENRRVTIRHEEIKNLEMPPMTMVFGVKDVSALSELKPGDRVLFRASKDGGGFVLDEIRLAP